MKISILIGTRNRTRPLLRCLDSIAAQRWPPHEVLVLDDASDRLRAADILAGSTIARVIRSETQLGVGPGRNRLMAEATGDAFVVLDDDAYLEDANFLSEVARELRDRPRAGILAARIVDHRAEGERLLMPFSRWARALDPGIGDRSQPVSYFLGGAHIVRREVYERTGGYDRSFVWGEEELDLSFHAINAGFEIHYIPGLTVHHRAEPQVLTSAQKRSRELFYHVRNRFVLARKYLPLAFAGPYLATWMGRHVAAALRSGDPLSVVRGVSEGMRIPVARVELTPAALAYLRNHHGRLLY